MKKITFTISDKIVESLDPWLDSISSFADTVFEIIEEEKKKKKIEEIEDESNISFQYGQDKTVTPSTNKVKKPKVPSPQNDKSVKNKKEISTGAKETGIKETGAKENEYSISLKIIKILLDKKRVKNIILAPLDKLQTLLDFFENEKDDSVSSQNSKEDSVSSQDSKEDSEDLKVLKEDLKTLHKYCKTIKKEGKNNILPLIFDYESFKAEYFYIWKRDGTQIRRAQNDKYNDKDKKKNKEKNKEINKDKDKEKDKEKNKEKNKEKKEYYSPQIIYNLMDLKACPYCNLEYIPHGDVYRRFIITKEEYEKKVKKLQKDNEPSEEDNEPSEEDKPLEIDKDNYLIKQKRSIDWEFDHFYPKSKYPYLAISVYNLIPVCSICNQRLKRDLSYPKKWYLHPFFDDFHEIAHFEFDFTSLDFLSSHKPDDIKVSLHKNKGINESYYTRAEYYCDFFALRDIDPDNNKKGRISLSHSDYLYEIYFKFLVYTKDFLLELQNKWGISDEDIKRLIFGNYTSPDEINKRPLAKVTIDMISQYEHLLPLKEEEKKKFFFKK